MTFREYLGCAFMTATFIGLVAFGIAPPTANAFQAALIMFTISFLLYTVPVFIIRTIKQIIEKCLK